jgi:hypothetical protein
MKEFEVRDEGYLELAFAIVKQAADDYRFAYRRFLKNGNRNPTMDYIEHWLLHGDGAILSLNKGEYILKTIREEEDAKKTQRDKRKRPPKVYTYNGCTMTLQEWADELDLSIRALQCRMKKKLPPEKIFERPKQKGR